MGGLEPMNIITDQDFGMRAGIEEVFPNTIHMHCRWHVIKKAEETLGPFLLKDQNCTKHLNCVLTTV